MTTAVLLYGSEFCTLATEHVTRLEQEKCDLSVQNDKILHNYEHSCSIWKERLTTEGYEIYGLDDRIWIPRKQRKSRGHRLILSMH